MRFLVDGGDGVLRMGAWKVEWRGMYPLSLFGSCAVVSVTRCECVGDVCVCLCVVESVCLEFLE